MADQHLLETIRSALKSSPHFDTENDLVDVSNGDGDFVHLVIVSRRLGGLRSQEKLDLISGVLENKLPPEQWSRVGLVTAVSPEELKSL